MSTNDINANFNPINLDPIFEDVDPLSEWLHEKENTLLDGENAGVLPMDTFDDEMDVNQSQQKNLSHSSSSSMPSQSGDGPDGGVLSPINEDDGYSGDRGEIRSFSQYGGEYGAVHLVGDRVLVTLGIVTHLLALKCAIPASNASPMYHPPPPLMYPPPQIYPPYQLYENQGENATFFGYIFGQRPRESSQEHSQSEGEGSDLPHHSINW
ncbi:hypothetical protein CXB51_025423 [Gossypium anomalum]|uniref:Uncharacterized protein n=1 Tax=Gossypium anomalum TaxID=47600 RepID=A0A8J5YA99_9ROSI|nr:hypothetical protein CXB51_025423 [Gossypium anomalum]